MPPKEDGTPRSFTFITGNPRSKKNITQIRRHAGQNSGHKAAIHTASTSAIGADSTPPSSSQPWNPRQYVPVASPSAFDVPGHSTPFPILLQHQDGWMDQSSAAGLSATAVPGMPSSSTSSERRDLLPSSLNLVQHPEGWHSGNTILKRHPEARSLESTVPAVPAAPSEVFGPSPSKSSSSHYPEGRLSESISNAMISPSALDLHDKQMSFARTIQYPDWTSQDAATGEVVTSSTIIEPSSPPSEKVPSISQPRKLTIRELMNTSDAEESDSGEGAHLKSVPAASSTFQAREYHAPSSPSVSKDPRGIQRPYDFKLPYELQDVTRIRRPPVRRKHDHQSSSHKHDDHEHHAALKANISKRRKPISNLTTTTANLTPTSMGQKLTPWRIGKNPIPSAITSISQPLHLSKDESLIEQTLFETETFYTSQFSTSWSQWQDENPTTLFLFDTTSTNAAFTFSGSITTAAGLIAISRIDSASTILNQILPSLHQLLTTQHPHLYSTLAELALDADTDTSLGRLRSQIKHFAGSLSHTVLGPTHPITRLLRLELSSFGQTTRLREAIQRRIHILHERLFSPSSTLTTGQCFHLARVLAQLGMTLEASTLVRGVTRTWEERYGRESLMCVLGMVEGAKMRLKTGEPLADLGFEEVEGLLLDALHRTTILLQMHHHHHHHGLEAQSHHQPPSSPESSSYRGRPSSPALPAAYAIIHTRMACLRTLGRLHAMQGRFHTALQYYTQSVQVGIEQLGASVPAVQLALADLDLASRMLVLADEGGSAGETGGGI